MRTVDLIEKKKNGGRLSREEISFLVRGYVSGDIPDYQMSAMLMAIWFNGMDPEETTGLTLEMRDSGDVIDLSGIPGVKVDKHSTGGVGDKTTLIVAPAAAACGVRVAKMSGRGLGHTGGTLDKLESIPGFRIALDRDEFFDTVKRTGLSVIGQTGNVVPADKLIYALRDVTATVDSIPLIASSIMSKKLAAGSDAIVLDVKAGRGAFMKTEADARCLAQAMVDIGRRAGRRVTALITAMDGPLGYCVGNAIEAEEAVAVLRDRGPSDLTELSIALAAEMVRLYDGSSEEEALSRVREALSSGAALNKLCEMVEAQGGDSGSLLKEGGLPMAKASYELKLSAGGFIRSVDAEMTGRAAMLLGAGREKKGDPISYGAGIRLLKKACDKVSAGETVAVLYADEPERFAAATELLKEAYCLTQEPVAPKPLIMGRI